VHAKRPLIFVPGIRTSSLALKKSDGHFEHFWPLMPHEFMIKDKLDRTFAYLDTKIRKKADDDVPVIATGLVPMAYAGLIRSILAWGYRPNVDFWTFPYDWRQSNSVSGQQLSRFIEEKTAGRQHDGIDIISHSMGGIITRAAQMYGARIRRTAYVACPHMGSPLAYFILHPEIKSQQFMSSFYLPDWAPNESSTATEGRKKTLYQRRKELFVKFPSMYELLPDESYLRGRPMLFADGEPVFGADNTYLKNDWAFKSPDMQTKVREAMEFKRVMGQKLLSKDNDILLICGTDRITCDTIRYLTYYQVPATSGRTSYVMQRGFLAPYDSGQHGDGYVPLASAMASAPASPRHLNSVFIAQPHTILPNEKTTIEAIGRFLAA
jgi:pimeloyl-ACP methyl ester carboxylesterase